MLGASADTVELNQKFTDKESYTFPLMCDTDLKLIKELGILAQGGKNAQRVTFVVDPNGKITKIFVGVTPKGHADEVLKAVKEQAGKK